MTKPFQQTAIYPNCSYDIPLENPFSQWVRIQPELDSKDGFTFSDIDLWCHRYKTDNGREFQCIMLVEVKSFGADLSNAQRDTLLFADAYLRNRSSTPTKKKRSQVSGGPPRIYSAILKRSVSVMALGQHKLRLSGANPDKSSWMTWDNKPIERQQLVSLLRLDIDPDSFGPLDFRLHHQSKAMELFA